MAKIEFENKVTFNSSQLPEINKCTAGNLNEIKDSVNFLYDNPIQVPKPPDNVLTVQLMTAGNLSYNPVYNNGVDGVGATLTATANGVLRDNSGVGLIDSVATPIAGTIIWVKNRANAIENGPYEITVRGDSSTEYVLTRPEDYNELPELYPLQINVLFGNVNKNTVWLQKTIDPEIGVDPIVVELTTLPQTLSPIRFIDTATNEPLPTFTYNQTDKTITFNSVGYFGNLNGCFATLQSNIEGGFRTFLVKDELNTEYNGTYAWLNVGSSIIAPKAVRLDAFGGQFSKNIRMFVVSNSFSDFYGKQYCVETTSPPLTTAGIGTQPIIFKELNQLYVETDVSELTEILIPNNLIEVGKKYIVTGCHKTLYDSDGNQSGTTLILDGIATNKVSSNGHGIFYNPKYDQGVQGFGIWTNLMQGTISNFLGDFDYLGRELIQGLDSVDSIVAEGKILANGLIQWRGGDWSEVVRIYGMVSEATADVTGFVSPNYIIGSSVIYGGYLWENVDGSVGKAVDVLNLDTSWSKVAYNPNYNQVLDIIEYDIDNDWISRRYNVQGNIDVVFTKSDYSLFGFDYSAIAVQQWGNNYNIDLGVGLLDKSIMNSYDESVNFRGQFQKDFEFINNSYQKQMIFESSSRQDNLYFKSISLQKNLVFNNGSGQSGIYLNNSVQLENFIVSNNSFMVRIDISSGEGMKNIIINDGSSIGNLKFYLSSRINNLYFTENSIFGGIDLVNSDLDFSGVKYITKEFRKTSFNGASGAIPDLNSATYISDSYHKTVYTRPDGQLRLSFMNDLNLLEVHQLTD